MVKSITNVIKVLAKHLKRLSKSSFDDFFAALCHLEAPRGCNQMQKKHLEGKPPMEVAEFILKCYTVRHWKAKVIQALKDINENQIRTNLQRELKADGVKKVVKKARNKEKTAPGTSGGQISAAEQKQDARASQQPGKDIKPKRGRKPKTDGKHFVLENRTNLIKSIFHMEPILDDLLEKKLLTQEQYDLVRKKGTSQDKMRELFNCIRAWGQKDNNKLLTILEKHNPIVIKNLMEKSRRKTRERQRSDR